MPGLYYLFKDLVPGETATFRSPRGEMSVTARESLQRKAWNTWVHVREYEVSNPQLMGDGDAPDWVKVPHGETV